MKNLENIDISAVIERLKDAFGVPSEYQLAQHLGTKGTTISNWRKREQIPYQACVITHFKTGKSLNWLLNGQEIKGSEELNRDMFLREFKETVVNGIQMELLSETKNTNDSTLDILGTHLFNALASKKEVAIEKTKKIS